MSDVWAALRADKMGQRVAGVAAAGVGALAGLMATAQLGAAWGAHLIDGGAPSAHHAAERRAQPVAAGTTQTLVAHSRADAAALMLPVVATPGSWRAAVLGPWGARVCIGPVRIDVPRHAPIRVSVTESGCEAGVITLTRLPAPPSWDGVEPERTI